MKFKSIRFVGMMKLFNKFYLLGVISILLACDRPPEYPTAPQISFRGLDFQSKAPNSQDTLGISINFQDGNGDLGLRAEDILPPFNQFDSVYDPATDEYDLVTNINYYNFFVDVFRVRNGELIKDERSGIINLFRGRFPILNPRADGDGLINDKPIDGFMRYTFTSSAFTPSTPIGGFNLTDTIQMSIYIKDRRMNKSNVVNTPQFIITGTGIRIL